MILELINWILIEILRFFIVVAWCTVGFKLATTCYDHDSYEKRALWFIILLVCTVLMIKIFIYLQ